MTARQTISASMSAPSPHQKRQTTYTLVVIALNPGRQAQQGQDLRLDAECNIEFLNNVVDAKRYTRPSPEHHHRWLETNRIMTAVVDHDLGYQLHRETVRLLHRSATGDGPE